MYNMHNNAPQSTKNYASHMICCGRHNDDVCVCSCVYPYWREDYHHKSIQHVSTPQWSCSRNNKNAPVYV
jgi:hypothetical protein